MMKKHSIYMFLGVLLTTTACSDDYFNHNEEAEYSDYIGYNVTVTGNDQFLSRSGGDAPHNSRQLTIDNTGATIGGRPLYLHTEVVDSIPMSISRAKKDTISSRGTITTAPANIGISAVVFDGDPTDWPGNAEAQMYMHNEELTASGNWLTNRYWPRENDWIRFYAYSPYDVLGENGLPVISTTEPSFSYTVDKDVTKQQDLLVGSEQYEGGWCRIAPLDMSHALAAVRIHIAGAVTQFTLKSVTISGLKNSGTYTYKYNPANYSVDANGNKVKTHDEGSWTDLSYEGDGTSASYNVFSGTRELTGTGGKDVYGNDNVKFFDDEVVSGYVDATPGNMVLLMMPQGLTADAKITITGKDGVLNSDVTLSATIGNADKSKAWEKGKMYTYTLSFSSTDIQYHLNVKPETAIPYYGIKDAPIEVISYKAVTRSGIATVNIPVPWEAVQIDANGNETAIPDWFMMQTLKGAGGDNATTYTYSAVPNLDESSSLSHQNIMKNAVKGTAEDPFNLSTNKMYSAGHDPENTANCYHVSAPGYYTFPLVYGNAITGGSTNSSAYKGYATSQTKGCQLTGTNGELTDDNGVALGSATVTFSSLGNFVDHKDQGITQPWIVNKNGRTGNYTPNSSPEIVWQDEPCLITDLKLNEAGDYITFRVRQDCVCEGNAVIAVKDTDGKTMWSWHIWVSDGKTYKENPLPGDSKEINFYDFSTNSFMTRSVKNRMTNDKWKEYNCTSGEYATPVAGSYTEAEFKILPTHLGHCDGETKNYTARDLKIRFKQVEDDNAEFQGETLTRECTFNQESGEVKTTDNIPYYQYGRKDPMLPTGDGYYQYSTLNNGGYNGSDKNYYINDWTQRTTIDDAGAQAKTLGEAIQNPGKFYRNPSGRETKTNAIQINNWCSSGPYINLWNTSSQYLPMFSAHMKIGSHGFHAPFNEVINAGVTKTIYDPCPPGFELPRVDAFSGATYSGTNLWPFCYIEGNTDIDINDFKDYGPRHHKQANVWLQGDLLASLDNYNAISIYCETMDEVGKRGDPGMEYGGPLLYVQFFGHRSGGNAKVAEYGNYAAALTGTPACIQWHERNQNKDFFEFRLLRLCIIQSTYSLRVFSASDFDLAFGIMPAINPSSTISGNADWSGDNSKIDANF